MKILMVNKFHYKKGGSETYYFTVAEALSARGYEVIYFAMRDDRKNIPCKQEEYFVSNASVQGGIKSKLNMVLHIAYSKEAYLNMKKLLMDEKPDLIIMNLVHKQITLSIIDAIKEYNSHLPIFWIMHDLITVCPAYTMIDGNGVICERCLEGSFKYCVENRCIKGSKVMSMLSKYEADYIRKRGWYSKVDLFVCPSEFYRKKLISANFTKSRIVTLRNPLPLGTKYELSDADDGYVLFFGRLSKEKGVKTLIDAAIKVGCKLIIVGTGPIEAELRDYVKNNDSIEFTGFQTGDILRNYIKKSRCVVLPSEWYENGPYSAMEAMALGKPLIVSNNGGLPELVEEGKNGYVYQTQPKNEQTAVDALAECIKKMTALSADEYRRMAECSLEKAKKLFNPNVYIDQIMKQYIAIKEHNKNMG